MCFVDFAPSFDSVERDSLWRIMAVDGMLPKLLRLIKAYYVLTKWLEQVIVTQCPLRSAPAFDKDVLSRLPSSIT